MCRLIGNKYLVQGNGLQKLELLLQQNLSKKLIY